MELIHEIKRAIDNRYSISINVLPSFVDAIDVFQVRVTKNMAMKDNDIFSFNMNLLTIDTIETLEKVLISAISTCIDKLGKTKNE